MPHPAVLFSCFCSLCILHLKNIRTGRSILVNDISDGLQQRFVQCIAVFLLFFASHKNVGGRGFYLESACGRVLRTVVFGDMSFV